MNTPDVLEYNAWWKTGHGTMYNRECLPPTHPEYIYNYLKREFNINPEDYGIYSPIYSITRDVKVLHNHLVKRGFNIPIATLQEIFYEMNDETICDPNYEENFRY